MAGADGSVEHFSRAEVAFMRWEIKRGVLDPIARACPSGSPWWRTINEELLRDCAEASLLSREGFTTGGSNPAVDLWLKFFSSPSADTWYRAHNASIVSGYLGASHLAHDESDAERVLMNVILTRALYAYLLAAKQARLGFLGRLGQWLANPAGDGIVAVIDIPDLYPAHYPMDEEAERQLVGVGTTPQAFLGRLANLLVTHDLERVFAWNAQRIGVPDLAKLTSNGAPCYPSGDTVVTEPVTRDSVILRDIERRFDEVAAKATPAGMDKLLPWVAGVSLQNVCFLSWEVPATSVAALLPGHLVADTHDGKYCISAVALRAVQMHFRGMPPLPGAAEYYELNFRTYVKHRDERGIYFISVDGTPGNMFEHLARYMFQIPYHRSAMAMSRAANTTFTSRRPDGGGVFDLTYTVAESPAAVPADGSIEQFICVRDLAFSSTLGMTMALEVRHPRWMVRPLTSVKVDAAGLFTAAGLDPPVENPTAFYADRSDGVMMLPVLV
jgi:uncharacterized protein YqjF (DUF2071 family)